LDEAVRLDALIQDETHSQLAEFDFGSSVGKGGQHYDGSVGHVVSETANRVHTLTVAHDRVYQNEARVSGLGASDCGGATFGNSNHIQVRFASETRQDLRTDLGVFISKDHGNAFHRWRV